MMDDPPRALATPRQLATPRKPPCARKWPCHFAGFAVIAASAAAWLAVLHCAGLL